MTSMIEQNNNFQNTLYTCDNLFVLNGMNSETIDLIYLDPPFNSKRLYSAPVGSKAAGTSFKDMWTWEDVDDAYLEKLTETHPYLVRYIETIKGLHGKAMMAYVLYMAQRIIEMHRVLKETGSFYLHCDPTASHYLKNVLDNIFGRENFRNEIVWQRTKGAKGSQYKAKKFGSSTDVILFYSKSENLYFDNRNIITQQEEMLKFPKQDEKGRRYNTATPIWRAKSMGDRPNLCYEWRGFRNPHLSGWRLSKERLEEEYQKGNIVIRNDNTLERRKYLDEYEGLTLDNNWVDIPRVGGNEDTGYATQKPLALLERVIKASCPRDGVILDPFCGCATTCVAAEKLNGDTNSSYKWIGIDIEKKAVELLVERLTEQQGGLFKNFIHLTKPPVRTDIKIEPMSKNVKERLFTQQKGCCNGCMVQMRIIDFEIDHVVPKARGGGDYFENYQLLCGNCNKTKGARPMDYLRNKIRARQELLRDKFSFGE